MTFRPSIFLAAVLTFSVILSETSDSFAAPTKAKPTPLPKVSITYTGRGSAQLNEVYSLYNASKACRIDTNSYGETVDSIDWNVNWKNINLITGANAQPTTATFSGTLTDNSQSLANLSGCTPFQLNSCQIQDPACVTFSDRCGSAPLGYLAGTSPNLSIEKKGKNFIITLEAESATDTTPINDPLSENPKDCGNSTTFDNNIVDGVNGMRLTRVKLQLKPSDKSKRTALAVNLPATFDCTDPSRIGAGGISNVCTITTAFQANLIINGKWKASIVN